MTMHWRGSNAKALIIFIPGGEGYIGLKEGDQDHPYPFFQTLKRLTNPNLTSGGFDVVLFDSPSELSPRQLYPSDRGAFDHMIRIESVIKFYKLKTGLPVWLMGHSNGGISLSEFFNYAKKNNKTDLISGFIVSGARSETYFDPPYTFPMLFIHHDKDGCSHTRAEASFKNFEKVKEVSQFPTEFVYVAGGMAEPKDPCRSGHHMYNAAAEEAAKHIDTFLKNMQP
jgi:hypothetical protein